jgi:hypothetical protein
MTLTQDVDRHNQVDIIETDEYGLYSGGWTKKELTPESFSHPAKISRRLVRWIYDHAIEEGWLKAGDVVIDPFFGIGGCALDGMAEGAIVVGAELERHFCDMSAGCDCTGITTEDFEAFRGHYETRYRIPQRRDLRFNPLEMKWERGRESAFAFDATEMVEWLCEYEDEADDIFDALVEYDVWVPGNFDAHRYEGERHWCPACVAAAKKAERDEKSGNGTDQMDMFSLIAPEWFTQPHHYEGNTERWKRWGLPGRAICLQGDSRELVKVLGKVDWARLGMGSPPYSEGLGHSMRKERQIDIDKGLYMAGGKLAYGESEGQLSVMPEGTLVTSSPAFGTAGTRDRSPVQDGEVASAMSRAYTQSKQGESDGNLASMGMGSPPFGEAQSGGTAIWDQQEKIQGRKFTDRSKGAGYVASRQGESKGNLAGMEMGGLDIPPEFRPLKFEVLDEYVEGDLVVSSSPWTKTEASDFHLDSSPKRFEQMYARYKAGGGGMTREQYRESCEKRQGGYGQSEGQLGAMPPGDISISSSPFAQSIGSDDPDKRGGLYRDPKRAQDVNLTGTYGETEGQLASMAVGSSPYAGSDVSSDGQRGIDTGDEVQTASRRKGKRAVTPDGYGESEGQLGSMGVGSPPMEDSAETGRAKNPMTFKGNPATGHYAEGQTIKGGGLYGSSEGQLGIEQGDTFWSAARLILLQLHQVTSPASGDNSTSPVVSGISTVILAGKLSVAQCNLTLTVKSTRMSRRG